MKKLLIASFLFVLAAAVHGQKAEIDHVALFVNNLQKSAGFYQQVIGLDTIADPFRDGKHVWLAMGEGTELHLIAGGPTPSRHPMDNHLCFRMSSFDTFVGRLTRAGVTYHNAKGVKNVITIRPDGVRQIYFTDPDGYWIEVNDAKN